MSTHRDFVTMRLAKYVLNNSYEFHSSKTYVCLHQQTDLPLIHSLSICSYVHPHIRPSIHQSIHPSIPGNGECP